jgi:hypothetical protein
MSAATDYLEQSLGNHLLRSSTFPKPSSLYIGLFTAMPISDNGTGGIEVSGNGYARVQIACQDSNWSAPVGGDGTFKNLNAIVFPQPTDTWGTVIGCGFFDSASSGNLLMIGTLSAPKEIGPLYIPIFPLNAIRVIID